MGTSEQSWMQGYNHLMDRSGSDQRLVLGGFGHAQAQLQVSSGPSLPGTCELGRLQASRLCSAGNKQMPPGLSSSDCCKACCPQEAQTLEHKGSKESAAAPHSGLDAAAALSRTLPAKPAPAAQHTATPLAASTLEIPESPAAYSSLAASQARCLPALKHRTGLLSLQCPTSDFKGCSGH
jgi:hypothetical protein